jgi:hypothetical protein
MQFLVMMRKIRREDEEDEEDEKEESCRYQKLDGGVVAFLDNTRLGNVVISSGKSGPTRFT